MKKYLLTLLLVGTIYSSDDWALWTTGNLDFNYHELFKGTFETENRFKNDFEEYHYDHLQWSLLFRLKKNNYIGPSYRHIYTKANSHKWDEEFQPRIILSNTLKINFLHFNTRVVPYYRIRDGRANTLAIRGRLGLDLLRSKYVTAYTDNEIFYHQNKFDQIDRNRFSIGVKGKIKLPSDSTLSWKTYYRRQDDKKTSAGNPWRGFNVLGVAIGGKF